MTTTSYRRALKRSQNRALHRVIVQRKEGQFKLRYPVLVGKDGFYAEIVWLGQLEKVDHSKIDRIVMIKGRG